MRFESTLLVCCLIPLLAAEGSKQASGAEEPAARRALFGDLHIHTTFSYDAFMGGVRTTPDQAYRYAKGEAIPNTNGSPIRLSGPPLDFLAVSDHAKYLGTHASLRLPGSLTYNHPATPQLIPETATGMITGRAAFLDLVDEYPELIDKSVVGGVWNKIMEAAERHYKPGSFTTFIGYEFTPTEGGLHLHRNVIFRGKGPDLPFSTLDSLNPEDLWDWLDDQRKQGIEVLAIPHNTNQSDGLAFQEKTFEGKAIDAAWAEQRIRNEPLVEISQQKGTSETHPSLSPNDEWADFQIVQYYLNRIENKDPVSVFKGGYVRDALKTGLEMEERDGFNPYKFGFIGSSDSHVSAGAYEEDRRFSSGQDTPQGRGSAPDGDSWEGFWTPRQATHGTGGLAGVWAEENTRESIYDAFRRKETFGTSGNRMQVRFFGGFNLEAGLIADQDPIAKAYQTGTPMGGVIEGASDGAPSFLVWALRDPNAGWLQRAQVVKGWIEGGAAKEQVFDVACSDGLKPDPGSHRCPDNGARVRLSDCSVSRDKGAGTLETLWTDPDFDPAQRAFYYVRVLENPSCRWSTWDALSLGIEPNPDLPATHQERAWSSPIWYEPRM